MMNPIPAIVGLAVLLGAGKIWAGQQPKSAPNVLVVLADQWRAQAFGFAGDPNVKTPHLDRLASQSVRFVNAISGMPVCCPARASLMTGQRPLTTGVFMNDVPLNSDAVTISKVLRAAGYDTAYIGKWHLNGEGRSRFIPRQRRQGFDYWKALECTHDYHRSHYYADETNMLTWDGYDAIAQTKDAAEYLRAHSGSQKPFFLFLAWGPPHDPYTTAPGRYRALYTPANIKLPSNVPEVMRDAARQMLAGYYAHCSALDDCIETLMLTLRETGLEQNTLILFTSDHGDMLGSHGGRNKQQPYDESIRVPLLIRWPAGLGTRGRGLDAMITLEDIMPTILGFCGVPIPNPVEGVDYSGYVRRGKNPSDGAALISCVAPFGQWTRKAGGREYRGIRTLRYTYVRDLQGPWLLFDNRKDPDQMDNLAGRPEAARLQRRLEVILHRKLTEAHDQFLPSQAYIRNWGYAVDQEGTVPYEP
ncbi:MAG TPA: sulfatase [Candidatus Paceibacterota bacterium]|nr:sulfatase [Verrucomicrobiota bacterium]HRY47594.1 sulfatase [Candidatus Paceibacterota bacterium]HSA00749.1 sulfatase [Candidatus Paceibacterota bacterium]